jgi:hypothetical protein
VVNLEGILKGRDIDLSALKTFKKQTWQHVDPYDGYNAYKTKNERAYCRQGRCVITDRPLD